MGNNLGKLSDSLSNKLEKVFYKLGSANDSEITTSVIALFKMIFVPLGTLSDKEASKEQKTYAATRDVLTEIIAVTTYIFGTKFIKNKFTPPLVERYYKKNANLDVDGKMIKELITLKQDSFGTDTKAMEALKKYNEHPFLPKFRKLESKIGELNKTRPEAPKNLFKKLFSSAKNQKLRMPEDLHLGTKCALSGLVVYVLALIVIPMGCNALLKPVLDVIKRKQGNKQNNAQLTAFSTPSPSPVFKSISNMQKPQGQAIRNYNGLVKPLGNMKVGG